MLKRSWILILGLIILSPLGLLAEGTAWGEWDTAEIQETVGYIPQGMESAKEWWSGFFPDYSLNVFSDSALGHSMEYILAAVLGSVLTYGISLLMVRLLVQKKSNSVCQTK